MITSALAALLTVVMLTLNWLNIHSPVMQKFLDSGASDWIGGIAAGYAFLTFFIWLPYKRDWERRQEIMKLEATVNALVIHSAHWGVEGVGSDVTQIALNHISRDGVFEMPCEIGLLGDPRWGLMKILTIHYSHERVRGVRSFHEHQIARLP